MIAWSSTKLDEIQQLEYCIQPDRSSDRMCYVIVTARSLLWTLLTIASTLAMVAAIVTPYWLIGEPKTPGLKGRVKDMSTLEAKTILPFSPSLGIYNRCTKVHNTGQLFTDSCAPFITSFNMPSDEFPDFWKASFIFFASGILIMIFTVFTSVIGCCKRSIRRKSIFTISGTIQAFAGLLYILGLMLYPAGWGSQRVKNICGELSSPYNIASCSLGWAFFLALGAILVTFVCSVLSLQAEISTSSDKVQDEISEGKNLICLL